jgi:hydroxypyruvate isomerase
MVEMQVHVSGQDYIPAILLKEVILMDRRTFISSGIAAGAAALAMRAGGSKAASGGKFKLNYGPYFGMFEQHAGKDPIDQLKFMADTGFTGMFDNGLPNKPKELQDKIAAECGRLGLKMGPFVAYAEFGEPTFVLKNDEIRKMVVDKTKAAVEVGKRTGCMYAVYAPGVYATNMEWDYQTANMVDNLKYCCEVAEPAGFTVLIEPLNNWTDHPRMFVQKVPQAYEICKAVGSEYCKMVNDLYHQQITEGNLIPNIDRAYEKIGAFHVGDNPGRKEPTTGEINYRNIFKHLHAKGYNGVLCMEHGKSKGGKEGEAALIEAYRWCDDF